MDPYAAAPQDFVTERDALVRSLEEEGRNDDAERVRAWRKPSIAAWAVNQAVRRSPGGLEELLACGGQLRQAQAHLLKGGEAAALATAASEERKAVAKLLEHAQAALHLAQGRAAVQTLDRVRDTLHAAASDDVLRAELEEGRVMRERRASGLGMFGTAGEAGSVGGGRGDPKPNRAARERRKAEQAAARHAAKAARTELREAAKAQTAAERMVRDAEKALAEARERLESAEEDQGAARVALDRAESRVRDLSPEA